MSSTADNEVSSVDDHGEYITGTNIKRPRNRDYYETDEEYESYLADYYSRYFPQAAEENRRISDSNRLRGDIHQDLPIYSGVFSSFSDIMTDVEIQDSRNKIR